MRTKAEARRLELPESLRNLDKPSLQALSYCLRHPDTWPRGFVWDYGHCSSCAMGLAHELWSGIPEVNPVDGPSVMAREFAMPYAEAKRIFLGSAEWLPTTEKIRGSLWWKERRRVVDFDAVTPEMVADEIDRHLAQP